MMRALTVVCVATLASAFTFWSTTLNAQVVPAIERQAGVCTSCSPDGWSVATTSPDVIIGDGAWPGGGYTVADVAGGPLAGSNMAFLLHNNGGVEEALRTTVNGLLPNQRYIYKVFAQGCGLTGAVTYTAQGTIARATVNGVSAEYTASAGDLWTPIEVTFTASAMGSAQIELRATGNSPTGFGTCAVFDAAPYTILPERFVNIEAPVTGALTNDSTPTISGQVLGAQSVSITIKDAQGMVVQTSVATADAQGGWSIDASMLADGVYTVEATIDDGQGNMSSSGPISFTLDATPPDLTLTAPAQNTLTNDNTPLAAGTTEPGLVVRVIIFDSMLNILEELTTTADAQGNWSVEAPSLMDGSYVIGAVTQDAAGNPSMGQNASITVDTVPPALALSAPMDGQLLPDADVRVLGSAEPGASITVELIDAAGQPAGVAMVSANAQGAWDASFMGLSDGVYTVKVTAQDSASNQANTQGSFEVDALAPMVQIDAPEDQAVSAEPSPTISGSATADAMVVVVIRDAQGAEVASVMAMVDPMTGAWSVTPEQPLADGEYTIEVSATRRNAKVANDSIDWTLDTQAPDTTITLPAQGMVSNDNQPTITGNSEPGAALEITITDAQGMIIETLSVSADDQGAWSVDSAMTLADGEYTINATATDAANNTAMAAPITWTIDATAPMVMISSPAQGTTTRETTITLEGSAEPGASVEIFVDGVKVDEVTADASGQWSVTIADLSVEEHTFEATSSDEAGNQGSSGQVTITVEATPAPVVITSPAQGSTITEPVVIVSGTGEPGATVTVTINGDEETITVKEDGTWSVEVTFAADGEQTITATDGEQQTSVTISVTLPPVDNGPDPYVVEGGCGCTSTTQAPGAPVAALLWLFGLVGLRLRRKR